MIKLFLVEDEIVMREGIKNNIDWEKEGIEFVGEASDGELAFPMIQKLRPDIIITDIKMPFMDGLELSRIVKKEMPEVKILILSGYNEFDYAKQAISIGITDYLLKPISSGKLLESVKEVAAKIREEKEQKAYMEKFKEEMAENEHLEKQKFFSELVANKLSMSEMLEKGKRLGMDLSAENYVILLGMVKKAGDKVNQYSEEAVEIMDKLNEAIEGDESCYLFDRGAEGFGVLVKGDSEFQIEDFLQARRGDFDHILKKYAGLEYFIGVGRTVQRLRELPDSFDEANKAFAYRYFEKTNRVVFYDRLEDSGFNQEDTLDLFNLDVGKIDKKILQNFLKSGLQEEVSHFVHDYFAGIGGKNIESFLFRQYITMDMYFGTIAFVEEMGGESEEIIKRCGDIANVSGMLSSVDTTIQYITDIIKEALTLRDTLSASRYSAILGSAIEYIEEHYHEEEISLNKVAAHVNMSPSHFSTIFSQEMGRTFIEYLTNVRMEKAKELLMCTNMKSSEVGYAAGYKDSHYFSYLFKKTQNCTPKEYRLRGKNTGADI